MRKKRFLSCLLVVLLLAVFSVTLVACKERVSQIVTPDAPVASEEEPTVGDLLLVMLKGMGNTEDFVSMDFESEIKTNLGSVEKPVWDYRKFYLKGNFRPNSGDMEGEVQLGLGVIATDENGVEKADKSQNFELFLNNGRFYLRAGETTLYLEDIDFNWLIEQLRKIGGLQNLIDSIMGLIPGAGDALGGTEVDELIGIVAMLIFQIDKQATTYNNDTGTGHISLKFNPDQLIDTVVKAIGGTSIDGLLAGYGMKLMLPDGNGGMRPYSIDDFLATLAFPNIDVYVEADIDNFNVVMEETANGYKGLQLHVYDWQTEYFHMSTGAFYSDNVIDILPANIQEYVPFGLLKLQFNTNITLDVNNVDVGKLVNFFAGAGFLPEDSLILSANANITIKLDADIRLKEEPNSADPKQMDDKSVFLLEVYGDNKNTPMVGMYLKNRKVYVNLDDAIKTSSGNIDVRPGNIVVDGVAVSKWLTHALGLGTDFVSGLIDSIFEKTPTPDSDQEGATLSAVNDIKFKEGYSAKDIVLTVGHNDNGKTYISPAFGTILDIIRYTVGFEKYITYDKDTGIINFEINNKFFQQINSQFHINLSQFEDMQDFGAINLGVDLSKGMAYFDLDLSKALFDADSTEQSTFKARVELDNFRYGFSNRAALVDKIDKAIEGKQYIGNLKDFIYNAVDDLDLEFEAKLHFDEGMYNASNILGIDTGLPNVNIQVKDPFDMQLKLKIQVQMDSVFVGYEKDENGKITDKEIWKQVISRAYIGITNVKSNPIFPKDNMTIRLYYLDSRYEPNGEMGILPIVRGSDTSYGTLYADMTEFNMIQIGIPSFAIGVDLTDLIFSALDKLSIDFVIPDFINPSTGNKTEGGSSNTLSVNGINTRTIKADDSSFVTALYTDETAEKTDRLIKLQLTSTLVQKIFDIFNVNIGFTLPEIDIDAEINKIDGIKLSIKTYDGTKEIGLDLGVNTFKMGSVVNVSVDDLLAGIKEDPNKFGAFINISDLTGDTNNGMLTEILHGIIYRALDDVDIKFSLNIHLDPGTYDVSNILGIDTGLPSIPITSSEGFDLNWDLSIKLQSAIVQKTDILGNDIEGEYEQIISRAMITLDNKTPNPLLPEVGAIRIMYFDDRYAGNEGLGLEDYSAKQTGTDSQGKPVYVVNKTHGTLLLNLLSFNLLHLTLPDVALDIDLTETIGNIIDNINLGDVAFSNDNNINNRSVLQSLYSMVNDNNAETGDSEGVSFIKIAFTKELVEELLRMFNVQLGITLPNFDGGIMIDAQNGVSISIASLDGNKKVNATLAMSKLHLGKQLKDEDIAVPENFNIANFGEAASLDMGKLLNTIIYRALDDVDLSFDLAFGITEGVYDVGKLLGMFGLKFSESIPITVSQDFVLDLTLRVQIRWNKFEGTGDKEESGITQARISLFNKVPNILFPTASDTEPALDIHYYDDRGPNNNTMNIIKFGQNGKKTHGGLYINSENFEFAKFKIPSMVIDLDLTELIKKLIDGLSLGNQSVVSEADVANYMSSTLSQGVATVADESTETSKGNYLQIAITMQLIKDLLKKFGVSADIPPLFDTLNGDFTISEINGIELSVDVTGTPEAGTAGNKISLDLGINYIKLGKETIIDSPATFDIYGTEVVTGMDSIIYRILDDTDVELKLTADVPAGKYNLAPILNMAGVKGITELFVEFTEAFNLDLTLKIQLQMSTVPKVDIKGDPVEGETETILARALIEIVSGSENFIFKKGSVAKIYYFDDRFEANKTDSKLNLQPYKYDAITNTVLKTHGTLFADFSGLRIANITIPPITMDIELTSLINQITAGLANNIQFNSTSNNSRMLDSGIGLVSDTNGPAAAPALGNYIKITVVTALINEILELLGVDIGIELPNFSVDIAADADKGFSVVLNIDTEDADTDVTKNINMMLSLPKLHLGVQNTVQVPADFVSTYYNTDFSNIVKTLLQYGEIQAKVNISANNSTINVQRLLNNILAASGMTLTLPINVDLNDFTNELAFGIKWAFDYDNPKNTNIAIELKCDGNMVLSIYMTGGNVYVDMLGLGLPKFVLENSGLAAKITNLVGNALDGLLGGLLSSGTAGLQEQVAVANNMSVGDMNTLLFNMARDGEITPDEDKPSDVMDYVELLLKGLSMKDGVLNLNITADMMRELLKELSINIAEDITVDAALDLFSGNIKLDLTFDEISVSAELTVVNIGAQHTVDINVGSGYEVLNMQSTNIFINSLFNVLDPGIWIDLISKNEAISDTFKYTKIVTEKVPLEGKALPYTNGGWANGGSILLTMLRMDGYAESWSGTPALYIIMDINAKQIVIRGTTNLLPINIGSALQADTMVNIPIAFDIKKMLTDLIGPIITEINTVDTETTGIEDVFNGFSVDSLLRGINVKIYGVKNIKVNVELNHNVINELVPNLINNGLNGMVITLNPAKGNSATISGLVYNNKPGTGFLDNFWDNLIKPVVQVAVADAGAGLVWGLVSGVVDGIKGNVLDLVSRLLPMPEFVELNANVYIINGKLDNIQLIGYGENNKGINRNRLELRIFNDLSQQAFFGYMDPIDLNNARFQSPYIHFDVAVDSSTNFANKFEQKAYVPQKYKMYYESTRNDSPNYLTKAADVVWNITYFNTDGFNLANNVPSGDTTFTRDNMDAFKNGGMWKTGYYIATGTAIIASKTYTTTVRVVIEDNTAFIQDPNTMVENIEVRAGRTLPTSITLTNKELEKSIYIRNVEGANNKFVLNNASQQTIEDHTIETTVTINLVGAQAVNKPIKIHWHNANLTLVEKDPIEISVFNFNDFFNNYYKAEKMLVLTSDGRRIYQEVESISITPGKDQLFELDANNNITGLANYNKWTSAEGFETELTIRLANAHKDQEILTRKVIVKPRIIDYVRFDSKNTIIMDVIQSQSDLPRTVDVYFKNGDHEVYNVDYNSWDFSKVVNTEATAGYERIMTWGKSGVYDNVEVRFNQDYSNIGSFNLNLVQGITIAINEAVINYAKVGPDNGERYCDISYEDFANKKFDNLDLRLISSDGRVTDYIDRLTYTVSLRKPAEYDEDGNLISAERTIKNDAAGRAELANMTAEELAKYVPITDSVLNFEIIDRGITIGDKGGIARVTVRLFNMKNNEYGECPTVEESKVQEVYLYFRVAAPIAREN